MHPAAGGPAGQPAMDGGPSDPRREREFRRARRHSRLVAVLKFGLPVIALLIIAGGVSLTWLARSLPEDVSVAAMGLEDGNIVMEDPRMSGFDKENRPYSMIAQRAIQSLDGGSIDLENVRASVPVGTDGTAEIVAAKGLYYPQAEKLRLYGNIAVETSEGMSIRLKEANIDLAAGRLVGTGPVRIGTPSQEIEAGSLTVSDGGDFISFGGRVKMTLLPERERNIAQRISRANDL